MVYTSVLIVGATGNLGVLITEAFANDSTFTDVRVLARKDALEDPDKKAKLDAFQAKGITVVNGDPSDVDTLHAAISKVDVVVSLLNGLGIQAQPGLLQASIAAGVKKFIPSEFGVSYEGIDEELLAPKKNIRASLTASKIDFTIFETGLFAETTFLPWFGFDEEAGTAIVYGDSTAKISWSHISDVAKALPTIINNPASTRKIVHIVNEELSWTEALNLYEEVTGKKITRIHKTLESLDAEIEATPKNSREAFVFRIRRWAATGTGQVHNPNTKQFVHFEQRTLRQYFETKKK